MTEEILEIPEEIIEIPEEMDNEMLLIGYKKFIILREKMLGLGLGLGLGWFVLAYK